MILAKAVFNLSGILPTMFKLRPNSLKYRAETTAAVGQCVSRANPLIKESNMIHFHSRGLTFHAEKISHISTIFYFGLEGLGGLELKTNQDHNVCSSFIFCATIVVYLSSRTGD